VSLWCEAPRMFSGLGPARATLCEHSLLGIGSVQLPALKLVAHSVTFRPTLVWRLANRGNSGILSMTVAQAGPQMVMSALNVR